jgi:uncharacterized protein YyaL (SSP411 family)
MLGGDANPKAFKGAAMPNRLAQEQSPYLLQHADNPVDWYPWGEEAFARAVAEDKPVFLSVGYATCHWCHVMAHETFENDEAAKLLNELFINVKVDREERPDVDSVYMTVCQLMTGSGGWPLTVIMTPDKKPFFAGTYFPREGDFPRPGMMNLARQIALAWNNERDKVHDAAGQIMSHLSAAAVPPVDPDAPLPDEQSATIAAESLAQRFDATHGGFGSAPKFPTPHYLLLLLRQSAATGDPKYRNMALATLAAMRRGGIFDQIGFGFHRYSTDQEWLLPHFEKMLYDQAMLTLAYAEAYQATGQELWSRVVHETLTYVERDLLDPTGAFHCGEDADSEGEEGKFYVWDAREVDRVLDEAGQDADLFKVAFSIRADGNFHDEATREPTGLNIPHLTKRRAEIATDAGISEQELERKLEAMRETLYEEREKRVRPQLDDKVITDWNGLMIAALARSGRVMDEKDPLDAADKALDFLEKTMLSGDVLLHRYRHGDAAIPGFIDDYAFLAFGALELFEARGEPRRLELAIRLAEILLARFEDDEGGFFITDVDAETVLVRQKEYFDAAIPSGNSATLWVLAKLATLTERDDFRDAAERLRRAAAGQLKTTPAGFCFMLCAARLLGENARLVALAGDARADVEPMQQALRTRYLPETTIFVARAELSGMVGPLADLDLTAAGAYIRTPDGWDGPYTDPDALLKTLDQ